jgi:hypothetical protein
MFFGINFSEAVLGSVEYFFLMCEAPDAALLSNIPIQ